MSSAPPAIAEFLLRRCLPAEDAEVIAGDLEETFNTVVVLERGLRAARRWYLAQTLSIVCARLLDRTVPQPDGVPGRRNAMMTLRQDLSYALRSLRKQPGFTSVAIVMLAVGIGATMAIASLAYAVLFKPLPYAEPDRLMLVHLLAPPHDAPSGPPSAAAVLQKNIWSYPKYQVFRATQQVFESSAAFAEWSWNLTGSSAAERLSGELVEASYFDVLRMSPHIGRTFTAAETATPASQPIAVLGHGLWVRRYGGNPSVIGTTVGLNGVPHTIVGVLPAGFKGLSGVADIWVPVTTQSATDLGEAFNHTYLVVARRKPEVSVAAAQAAVVLLGAEVYRQFPGGQTIWSATAVPLDDERAGDVVRRSILLLLAAVGFVLLIVCINLANLMLIRGIARHREIAIRLALGATRARIIRQLMTESLLVAGVGAAVGLTIASTVRSAAAAVMPDLRIVLPRDQTAGLTRVGLGLLELDVTVVAIALAIAAVTAMLFGLGPAWRATRRDITTSIKSGSGAVSEGTRGFALRNVLVAGEMALALVLLTAGGLMIKSMLRLHATDQGFDPRNVMTFRLGLPGTQYTPERATQFLAHAVERVGVIPGIEAAAYASCAPVGAGCNATTASFPDRPPLPKGPNPIVGVLWASPGYFETMHIPLKHGRVFNVHDRAGQPKVVVVNETAARAFWKGEDPIGRRIALGQGGFQDGAEVIGVVADVRYGAIEAAVRPEVYIPLQQSRRAMGYLFVKSRTAPDALVPMVSGAIRTLDPDLPLTDIKHMDARFADATWRTRMGATLLGTFATLALVLAAMGIYGVMSQGVQQRTREIGVRLALGAARADIVRLIVSRVCVIAACGILVGIVVAVPSMQLLRTLLYDVRPGDPLVFGLLAFVLLTVALIAGYIPARRAARVDPMVTLRME
jgi:putative ABC transport system permease protein